MNTINFTDFGKHRNIFIKFAPTNQIPGFAPGRVMNILAIYRE